MIALTKAMRETIDREAGGDIVHVQSAAECGGDRFRDRWVVVSVIGKADTFAVGYPDGDKNPDA